MESLIEKVLISEDEIHKRLDSMALEILTGFDGRPITVVAVLKGALVLVADLFRRLPVKLDIEFVTAQSYYGGTETTGEVKVIGGLPDVKGKSILLVDDILDTGLTMEALKSQLIDAGADSVATCVLLSKVKERAVDVEADYYGFEIGDEFVVGYGLDYTGHYRNLPYIGILKEFGV